METGQEPLSFSSILDLGVIAFVASNISPSERDLKKIEVIDS